MEYIVYSINFIGIESKYYGRSQEFDKRKRSHINLLRKNKHNNTYLQEAYNKYGESEMYFEVLHIVYDLLEAINIEEEYINNKNLPKFNISDAYDGGDTFTNNPRKEDIRKLKSKNSSGKNNGMYGKPKSQKMIQAVKDKNSKPIVVYGVVYPSALEYSKVSGVGTTTVSYRLHNPKNKDYVFLSELNAERLA